MEKKTYIKTDDNTANLAELLLLEIQNLNAKVNMLSNPLETAKLMNEDKAAEMLDISKRALITLRNEGKIHYRQIGNSIRYSLADILEFQDNCKG
jgi:hypothetical protein